MSAKIIDLPVTEEGFPTATEIHDFFCTSKWALTREIIQYAKLVVPEENKVDVMSQINSCTFGHEVVEVVQKWRERLTGADPLTEKLRDLGINNPSWQAEELRKLAMTTTNE